MAPTRLSHLTGGKLHLMAEILALTIYPVEPLSQGTCLLSCLRQQQLVGIHRMIQTSRSIEPWGEGKANISCTDLS